MWAQTRMTVLLIFLKGKFESAFDHFVHVVVAVFSESAAEDDFPVPVGQRLVAFVKFRVALVIDGVVGLGSMFVRGRVFPGNDRAGLIAARFEMLVFDDPGVGNFALGEIHYGDALIVGGVERFVFEAQRAVLQLSESKIVVFVDAARENDAVAEAFPVRAVGEEIGVAAHLDACEQSVHEFVVAAMGIPCQRSLK